MPLGRRLSEIAVASIGAAVWGTASLVLIEDLDSAIGSFGFLMIGPAWAYASCLAATDDDFPEDAWRDRDQWLRIIPWTFVLAPLVLPNFVLLIQFFRDSRADHGQTWLGSGRSRPGEGREEMFR